ncbi:MAG: phosphonate metabolism protein/1,5-bisphosphokinase (PRPP-forming) PhnN [Mesorhizobium sp.]|nr:phosphonate metabolism protein/1,5-bisphosphokinase (PRPP-forming) PhnN [Mesorhizobium sp.]MBL8576794.1 phosphonate metabolism protein/1,5-bisphosphokinase (PRPP-forming) PhnN [Mesorhizobium sp.]
MMTSALLERVQAGALPIRNGAFVAIVGPSGAGKDTLIAHAMAALGGEPQVDFVRRVITRPCDGSTEQHDTLSDEAFVQAQSDGAFALAWEAHGLRYGIPSSVDTALDNGHVAVANLSRGALPALRERYANVAVVEITADPEILASRLAGRGRETRDEILARLARTISCDTTGPSIVLDNGGAPEIAGDKLVAIIRKAMAFADISGTV